MFKKVLVWTLIYGLLLAPVNYAQAQISADPNAAGANKPQVLNTANGAPQVNIVTPNKKGLSHNKYQQFDVDGKGAVLNNSNRNVQTQIGGWIEGNPNLAGGPAKTILNEVNSSNPTQLKGMVEVGGQKADVIIANPSGINVDGGGFINAGRATLTTGRPQISDGQLTGYRVEGGRVEISGAGMNAKGSDYTDIISQSVAINAGLHANNLTVVTGRNKVSADGSQAAALDANATSPGVALDVSALGGMYAGQIKLIGTEKGLGVHNAGEIVASVGEVVITQKGRLENIGLVHGQKAVKTEASKIKNQGRIQSAGSVSVKVSEKIDNKGEILANESVKVVSGGEVTNSGDIEAGLSLEVKAANKVTNHEGASLLGWETNIEADQLHNEGLIDGGEVVIRADSIINILTGTIFGDHLALAARYILNGLPLSIADGRTEAASGLIAARGRLDTAVSETLINREQGIILSGGDWYIGLGLDENNQVVGRGGEVVNSSAVIDVAGSL